MSTHYTAMEQEEGPVPESEFSIDDVVAALIPNDAKVYVENILGDVPVHTPYIVLLRQGLDVAAAKARKAGDRASCNVIYALRDLVIALRGVEMPRPLKLKVHCTVELYLDGSFSIGDKDAVKDLAQNALQEMLDERVESEELELGSERVIAVGVDVASLETEAP